MDIGRPIWAAGTDDVPLPAISGLVEADPTLHAILISHPHLDHYGLLGKVASEVPVLMGAEAAAVLRAASFFSSGAAIEPAACFADREPLSVGPFTVTPFLNDHSAFDAYSLLIEADDRRLFYTGDIRGHGRKRALFEALLGNPPLNVDVMLMEGTNVRSDARRDTEVLESESDLELRFVDLLRGTRGAVAVVGSAQNLDRLVTVYRAARRSGRQLVVDLYGASVAAASRPTIPQVGFPDLRVYVPQRQRVLVKESREFDRVNQLGGSRVFGEELRSTPDKFVYHVPTSVVFELIAQEAIVTPGAVVWSLWEGYLRDGSGQRLRAKLLDKTNAVLLGERGDLAGEFGRPLAGVCHAAVSHEGDATRGYVRRAMLFRPGDPGHKWPLGARFYSGEEEEAAAC